MKINHTTSLAQKRKMRVRAKLYGTALRPRVTVFRSNQYTYVQAIDDANGVTLAGANELALKKAKKEVKGTKIERARQVAEFVAEQLKAKKIEAVCFDRGSYRYHGRVKVIADTLREAGVKV